MEFLDMLIRLKILYDEKIVLISCGAFYIAIGGDAELLNKELGLNKNCVSRHICKVGVPKSYIGKYIEKIRKLGYSYIVLNYVAKEEKLIVIDEFKGNRKILNYIYKTDCAKCSRYKACNETKYDRVFSEYINRLEKGIK